MTRQVRRAKRKPREMQLLSEWLAIHYPHDLVMTRVRLGTIQGTNGEASLDTPEGRAFATWRRWADAVVVTDRELLVVEAKIKPDVGVVSQLKMYLRLVKVTPELDPYRDRPIVGVLLTAVDDPSLGSLATEEGYRYVVYRPAWVNDYLSELLPRERRPRASR